MQKTTTLNHNNEKKQTPIFVGLDIGTTKIAVIAGRKNEAGRLEVLALGTAPSKGIEHGQVLNLNQAVESINAGLLSCKTNNPNINIDDVYVGIAGNHIQSIQSKGDMIRQNAEEEIEKSEVDQLIAHQKKTFVPAGNEIIDVIPQEYYIDNLQNIKDPIGYNGTKVGASFHIITGDTRAIVNINRAVHRAGLTPKNIVLQPLASASAVTNDMDLEAGVAILDIGGGTSDLAIFHEGMLLHTAVIPYGGENVTKDIKIGLGLLMHEAEELKKTYGSAIPDPSKGNYYITIKPRREGMPQKQVGMNALADIIQARMTEILDSVSFHLKQVGANRNKLLGGIILTGGGAQLQNLVQLTEYVTGLPARIGQPIEHLENNSAAELCNPMFATCLGLVLKGCYDYEDALYTQQIKNEEHLQTISSEEKDFVILQKEQENYAAQEVETQPVVATQKKQKKNSFWNGITEKVKKGLDEMSGRHFDDTRL